MRAQDADVDRRSPLYLAKALRMYLICGGPFARFRSRGSFCPGDVVADRCDRLDKILVTATPRLRGCGEEADDNPREVTGTQEGTATIGEPGAQDVDPTAEHGVETVGQGGWQMVARGQWPRDPWAVARAQPLHMIGSAGRLRVSSSVSPYVP